MPKENKETPVKVADEKANAAQKGDLQKLVLQEAMKITEGKEHSVQQMMAYCRQLKKRA